VDEAVRSSLASKAQGGQVQFINESLNDADGIV
jgi:hypothetical protein